METFQNQHDKAAEDIQAYLANPINAYLLVKRLTTDWRNIEQIINTNVGQGMKFQNKNYTWSSHLL